MAKDDEVPNKGEKKAGGTGASDQFTNLPPREVSRKRAGQTSRSSERAPSKTERQLEELAETGPKTVTSRPTLPK